MTVHQLKIWPEHLFAILHGKKTCEVRVNDREYYVGDVLSLRPYDPQKKEYIEEFEFKYQVTHVDCVPHSKYVVLSIKAFEV